MVGDAEEPFVWMPVFKKEAPGISADYSSQHRLQGEPMPISHRKLEQLISGFEGYEVDTIELNIAGAIETGGPLQFIVSGKAEAGMTVTLKKKGTGKKDA